jgi:hypothetical protein
VGRAFLIWWNFDDFLNMVSTLSKPERIGSALE